MKGLPTDQVLAIVRLKEWSRERVAIHAGRTSHYKQRGRPAKHPSNNRQEAAIIRVADFEIALSQLTHEEQTALVVVYRDGNGLSAAAAAVGCSIRKLDYLLPAARTHLAEILDRRDML